VIRYSFGVLEARWKGSPLPDGKVSVLPPAYHPIKDVSHAVFLAALLFDEPQGPDARAHAATAVDAIEATMAQLDDASSLTTALIPQAMLPAQKRLLAATRDALVAFTRATLDSAGQAAYFARVRADLLANLRAVAGALVTSLDANVRRFRKAVEAKDPSAWDSVVVVVGVMHQARAREIGIQYFERLLGEPVGEGARNERRLVVAEDMTRGPEQYGLLSAHLVDRAGAWKIFADPSRLQWDVMADDGGVLDSLLPRPSASVARP
jgi:hypothetical protein